jgi:hypothetical protein
VLRGDFTATCARSASQLATNVRSRVVDAAYELARFFFDPQRRAMTVDHTHVSAVAVEASKLVTALGKTRVIVASDAHVILEQRKTTHAARHARGRYRHFWIMYGHPTLLSSSRIFRRN